MAAATLAAVRRANRGARAHGAGRRGSSYLDRSPAHFSGAGADARDPQFVSEGISELVETRGWQSRARVASVIGRWNEIAGEQLASHVSPVEYDAESGQLTLQADSTAWATQTRVLIPELAARLDELVSAGVVRQIEVRGPRPPRTRFGKLRVPGRGPRDTYG